MSDPLNTTLKEIKNTFGNDLVSLVMFGSYGQKKDSFKIASDVDFLIIIKSEVKNQDIISRQIKHRLKHPFPLPAFNIYSQKNLKKALERNPWLVLSVREGYRVAVDQGDYFVQTLEAAFKRIAHQKLGVLSWHIKDLDYSDSLRRHYHWATDEYLRAADLLFTNNMPVIALDNLSRSVHTFMIDRLFKRGISMTVGEITQMFFNVYTDDKIRRHMDDLLKLEQITGQNYSFGFDKSGNMSFNDKNILKIRSVYKTCRQHFQILIDYFKHD